MLAQAQHTVFLSLLMLQVSIGGDSQVLFGDIYILLVCLLTKPVDLIYFQSLNNNDHSFELHILCFELITL